MADPLPAIIAITDSKNKNPSVISRTCSSCVTLSFTQSPVSNYGGTLGSRLTFFCRVLIKIGTINGDASVMILAKFRSDT